MPPGFCALIPVYNEAEILAETVVRMVAQLRTFGAPFELLLCENGSTDGTLHIARDLAGRFPEVRVEHLDTADYGLALKHGMGVCRYELVVIFNLDFWSADFARAALEQLQWSDVVLGSKTMTGSADRRPLLRRGITRSFNAFLRYAFGFRGTDTHGMKAARRTPALPVLASCATAGWVLDTEFVLLAERRGLAIVEIPVEVREVRAPGYWAIARRVPRVMRSLVILWRALGHVPRSDFSRRDNSADADDRANRAGETALLRHDR